MGTSQGLHGPGDARKYLSTKAPNKNTPSQIPGTTQANGEAPRFGQIWKVGAIQAELDIGKEKWEGGGKSWEDATWTCQQNRRPGLAEQGKIRYT